MALDTHFWKFRYTNDNTNINNIPVIVPGSPVAAPPDVSGRQVNPDLQPTTPAVIEKVSVDVVTDFPWTNHGRGAREKVPRIVLREKTIKTSPYVTTMINSALDAGGSISSILEKPAASIAVNTAKQTAIDAANLVKKGSGDAIAAGIQGKLTELSNKIEAIGSKYDAPASDFLKTYQGLYILEPSGFIYTFPLGAEALAMSVDNSFGEEKSDNEAKGTGSLFNPLTLLSGIAKGASAAAEGARAIDAFAEPGSYFEKSKFFDIPPDGEMWTVNFTLSNIGDTSLSSADNITRNFNLLFLLIYQNTPGRRSRSLIDPPAMYEVFIDGVTYSPYAYIKSIAVTPRGRIITKTIPFKQKKSGTGGSFDSISTAVPEAWDVKIVIQSLHAKTKNFVLAGLEGSGLETRATSVSSILSK